MFSLLGIFFLFSLFINFTSASANPNATTPVRKLEIIPPKDIKINVDSVDSTVKKNLDAFSEKLRQEQQKKDDAQRNQNMSEVGINVDPDCLVHGGCSFSIYDALNIRNDREV